MNTEFTKMVELSDAELDAVCGGARGLVAVEVGNVNVLNDSINDNDVGVAVAAAVLGIAGAGNAQNDRGPKSNK